ncbi:hypothetical protein FEM48_ZijujUnG0099200 [Ziziphus jujuba var. spinosa]|uniref:F-box domain-containing protein n=1 Tax=Ziziphus jujuba var. spinosa TaxID=714518 RepID=A0A978U8A0_ZIZJJ|nr:hypothetical protein FEM48_ZijujUnG0099200 [Ziziphus jujuba var. spinosa]
MVVENLLCDELLQEIFLKLPPSSSSSVSLVSKRWLYLYRASKTSLSLQLSIWVCNEECLLDQANEVNMGYVLCSREDFDADLGLESLSLSGIRADDWGIGWLWRSCKKLKKPQLRSCDGIGDGGSFSSFLRCLQGIREVELRTCRSIVDGVLLKLAENCDSLNSLLVYDGGSREVLLRFFSQCSCKLQKFDLRLSLDLNNDHLLAVAVNFRMSGLLSQ